MNKGRTGVGAAVRLSGALLAGALVITACGSSAKTSSSTSVSASTTAAGATTSAPATSGSSGSGSGGSSTTLALAGGTASISGPGVTATEIKLGTIATVSGPVPGLFQKSADTMDAFAQYINSQGGIDGHKLVIVHMDDAYDCVTYTSDIQKLSTEVFALVGSFSVEDVCGAATLKANPNLADIEADIINPQLDALPNAFAGVTQPKGFQTTGYQWVKTQYPNDITHAAEIYPTTAQFSEQSETTAAKSIGYKYLYINGVGTTDTNFTSDILRMKADGVKVVDLSPDPVTTVSSFEQEAAQQNFHPDAVLGPTAYDSNFFKLVGNPGVATNLIMPLFYPMFLGQDTSTNPELAAYLTSLNKAFPNEQTDLFGTTSWAAAVLFAQAMQAAGASGPVTQASLITALGHVGPFTANGMDPSTDPSPGHRAGPTCEVIAGVKGNQFVRIDPATSGYECNGTYVNLP